MTEMTHYKKFTQILIYILPNLLQNNLFILSEVGGVSTGTYFTLQIKLLSSKENLFPGKKYQRKQVCENGKQFNDERRTDSYLRFT